ncbi:MAG: hypothetical protein KatS3mg038_0057 [Candidatus Kapaibacterium sp.]|nr:MAG: hypothetical protein KatS3mg038_0057 [Candidatus Kapabacteria bacterium]
MGNSMYVPLAIALLVLMVGCSTNQQKPLELRDTTIGQPSGGNAEPITIRDSLRLRYNPTSGMELHCVLEQSETLDQDSLHVRAQTVWYFTQAVERREPNGRIHMRMRYDSIRLEQHYWQGDSAAVQVVRYNSARQADRQDERFDMLTAAIGKEVRAAISALGAVEEITGTGQILRALLGARADSLTQDQRQQLERQLEAELYAQVLAQQFLLLPESSLDSSRSWSRSIPQQIPPLFVATAKATYRLDSLERTKGDSLLLISAVLDGKIQLVPEVEKQGVVLRTGTVQGAALGMLSARYGLMVRRSNTVEYAIAAEVSPRKSSREQLRQYRRSVSQFRVQSVQMRQQ